MRTALQAWGFGTLQPPALANVNGRPSTVPLFFFVFFSPGLICAQLRALETGDVVLAIHPQAVQPL